MEQMNIGNQILLIFDYCIKFYFNILLKKKSLSSSNVNISHSNLQINNSYFKSRGV